MLRQAALTEFGLQALNASCQAGAPTGRLRSHPRRRPLPAAGAASLRAACLCQRTAARVLPSVLGALAAQLHVHV